MVPANPTVAGGTVEAEPSGVGIGTGTHSGNTFLYGRRPRHAPLRLRGVCQADAVLVFQLLFGKEPILFR